MARESVMSTPIFDELLREMAQRAEPRPPAPPPPEPPEPEPPVANDQHRAARGRRRRAD